MNNQTLTNKCIFCKAKLKYVSNKLLAYFGYWYCISSNCDFNFVIEGFNNSKIFFFNYKHHYIEYNISKKELRVIVKNSKLTITNYEFDKSSILQKLDFILSFQ